MSTCTAEVFRPASTPENPILENRGLQNLSLQVIETRKDSAVHVSLSSSSLVKQPGVQTPLPSLGAFHLWKPSSRGKPSEDPISTANDNRLASAVDSLSLVRSVTGTKTCLGQGPRQRRAQWAVYKPAGSPLSTAVVNKSPHPATDCRNARQHSSFTSL